MATTGFFNGVKKQIRKIVKPIDVRVGKYNNNLKKQMLILIKQSKNHLYIMSPTLIQTGRLLLSLAKERHSLLNEKPILKLNEIRNTTVSR